MRALTRALGILRGSELPNGWSEAYRTLAQSGCRPAVMMLHDALLDRPQRAMMRCTLHRARSARDGHFKPIGAGRWQRALERGWRLPSKSLRQTTSNELVLARGPSPQTSLRAVALLSRGHSAWLFRGEPRCRASTAARASSVAARADTSAARSAARSSSVAARASRGPTDPTARRGWVGRARENPAACARFRWAAATGACCKRSSTDTQKKEKPGQRRASSQARRPSAARCRLSHRKSLRENGWILESVKVDWTTTFGLCPKGPKVRRGGG